MSAVLKTVINHLPFVRTDQPSRVKHWCEKLKGVPITKLTICRVPVSSAIQRFVNVVTLGNFNRAKKALNYDDVFHLFMKVEFKNGTILRIDKNHRVEITTNIEHGGESFPVFLPPVFINTDLSCFLARGNKIGGDRYYVYDAINANCQLFVLWTLIGNRLLNIKLQAFINQDAETLVKSNLVRKGFRQITDLAHRADILIRGAGRRKKSKLSRSVSTE